MHAKAVSRLKVETDLRRAIDREEFRLHYEPIVSMRDCRIIGFEALVRWQRPGLLMSGLPRLRSGQVPPRRLRKKCSEFSGPADPSGTQKPRRKNRGMTVTTASSVQPLLALAHPAQAESLCH